MPYVAPPVLSVMSPSVATCFRHRRIRTIPPVLSPCSLRYNGAIRAVCFRDNLVHSLLRHSYRWRVPTRGEVGWKSRIGGLTSKVPGIHVLAKTISTWFFRGIRPKVGVVSKCCSSRRGCPARCLCRAPIPRMSLLDHKSVIGRRASALP
jgi:hypothetical protein